MARITHFAMGLATLALAVGCERESDPLLCGDIGAGDLVITELRGGPDITDGAGQWIELYNAAGGAVDLHGVAVSIESIGGGSSDRLLLRRPVTVGAGAYGVVGKFADGQQPAHVDYGWGTKPGIPVDGLITIACGATEIDRFSFTMLPSPARVTTGPTPANHGTYQFGAAAPTAADNDDRTRWCPDPTETTGTGNVKDYLGSPGEPNPGCTP